ncbi:MAG: M1 family metallopeptidase, partial [Romboutsia sp.]
MIINFSKKVRRVLGIVVAVIILLGGGAYYVNDNKSSVESFKLDENKILNKYTMDIIFDDESKRLMCNQNIEYINNTDIELDKVYFHIYPNAFSKKEFAPFEKDEMEQAYPNGFNEG